MIMITVLITGCSMHSYDLITELRRNYENEDIKVVGINCAEDALLRKGVDAGYIVPRITEPDYIPTVLDICKKENVDVILPFITAELPIMADNKKFFEDEGIKVSVTSKSSLELVGEKTSLYGLFGSSMPKQSIVHTINNVDRFACLVGYPEKNICCKLPNRCGGLGFAVIDEEKGKDLTIMNKFGMNRYITLSMLKEYVQYSLDKGEKVILQEYAEGVDYSMCVLADNGKVTHALGFEADLMAYGSAMFAKISFNTKACEIAKEIVEKSGLDGNACFDFIITPDGEAVLLECNPRVNATLPFIARAGLNLPYLRCKQLLGFDILKYDIDINYDLKMSKNYESEYYI